MTCRAVGWRSNVVLLAELFAELGARLGPSHVGDLFDRPQVRLWIAMAVQAPAHAERLVLVDLFHLIDPTVTAHAADAAGHVGAVVEVGVVREVVDLHPFNGLARLVALAAGRELRAGRPNFAVTVHARLRCGDGRVRTVLDGVVAVPAVDAELTGVQRMAVRDRLLRHVADVRRFRGSAVPDERDQVDRRDPKHDSCDLPSFIGPAREYEQIHHQKPRLVARASPSAARIRRGGGSIGEAETGSDGSLHPRATRASLLGVARGAARSERVRRLRSYLRLRVRAYALASPKCKEKLVSQSPFRLQCCEIAQFCRVRTAPKQVSGALHHRYISLTQKREPPSPSWAGGSVGKVEVTASPRKSRRCSTLGLEISHLPANLTDRLFLKLTDAFARQVVLVADLLERQLVLVIEAEAPANDARFDGRQGVEQALDLFGPLLVCEALVR